MKIAVHTSDGGRAVIIFDGAVAVVLTREQAEELFDRLGAWVQGDLTQEDIDQLLKG